MPENSIASRSDRWSDLISDGHVRAARLRLIKPYLYGVGVSAILIGFYMALAVPPRHDDNRQTPGQSEVERAQLPVNKALEGLPALELSNDDGPKAEKESELPQVQAMVLADLTKTGKISSIPVVNLTPDRFWHDPWPVGSLVSTSSGDVILLGSIATPDGYVSPFRWIAVYSRRNGKWEMLTTTDAPFRPESKVTASLKDIPLTLRPVLPKAP